VQKQHDLRPFMRDLSAKSGVFDAFLRAKMLELGVKVTAMLSGSFRL
jgi:hypothetical protein